MEKCNIGIRTKNSFMETISNMFYALALRSNLLSVGEDKNIKIDLKYQNLVLINASQYALVPSILIEMDQNTLK